jgi:hypothetical protein
MTEIPSYSVLWITAGVKEFIVARLGLAAMPREILDGQELAKETGGIAPAPSHPIRRFP